MNSREFINVIKGIFVLFIIGWVIFEIDKIFHWFDQIGPIIEIIIGIITLISIIIIIGGIIYVSYRFFQNKRKNINNQEYINIGNNRKSELKKLFNYDIPLSDFDLGKMTQIQFEKYKIKMIEFSEKLRLSQERLKEINNFFPDFELPKDLDLGSLTTEEYSQYKADLIKIRDYKKSLFWRILQEIKSFQSPKHYDTEEGYHGTLYTWLKAKFPGAKYEHRQGFTRPDIVIENIAIEVKGPTFKRDLDTIPNKCMDIEIIMKSLLWYYLTLKLMKNDINHGIIVSLTIIKTHTRILKL